MDSRLLPVAAGMHVQACAAAATPPVLCAWQFWRCGRSRRIAVRRHSGRFPNERRVSRRGGDAPGNCTASDAVGQHEGQCRAGVPQHRPRQVHQPGGAGVTFCCSGCWKPFSGDAGCAATWRQVDHRPSLCRWLLNAEEECATGFHLFQSGHGRAKFASQQTWCCLQVRAAMEETAALTGLPPAPQGRLPPQQQPASLAT